MNQRTSASLSLAAAIDSLEPRTLLAALSSGVSIARTISTSNQVDLHTITVTQNYPFLIAVHDTSNSGFTPRVRVLSPSSSAVFDQTSDDGLAAIVPTATTGQYTVEISSASGTGSYSLMVSRPTAPSDVVVEVADSGHRFADTIGGSGDTDYFALDAIAGNAVGVTATQNTPNLTFDPKLTFIAPDGRIVGQAGDEEGVRFEERATKTGRYFATVSDDGGEDSGVFGLTMTRVPGPQYTGDLDSLPLNSGVTRSIDVPAGDADCMELLNIRAGDEVTVTFARDSGQDLDPDMILYDPNGAQVIRGTRANGTSILTTTALLTGSYWVVARDFEADDGGSGTFRYDVTHNNTTRVIEGTGANDRIQVTFLEGGSVRVSLNGAVTDYDLEPGDHLDIRGNDGDDIIDLRGGDTSNYIATAGIYVTGGSGDDTIYGGVGNDTITGGAGRNRLFGGDGKDRINGSGGRDFIYGEAGDDRLYGQGGNDYIDGGGNVDRVYGGDGDDSLFGGNSNDRIYAGAGNDTLIGGKGNDYLNGEDGTDLVQAKEAGDTLISIESQA
jgi:Ca2+-binding RTX toxin-like protein